MNTINNPLILRKTEDNKYAINRSYTTNQSGEYIDKVLAEEILSALEDYRDFLITGVSGESTEDICKLITKIKG